MRCLLTALGIFAFMAVSFAAISLTVAHVFVRSEEKRRTVVVGPEVPDRFPVLVVDPAGPSDGRQARIVFHSDLRSYMREHPRHTFHVPSGAASDLNAWLAEHPTLLDVTYGKETRFGAGRFEVRDLPGGRQALKVEGAWNDDRVNVGWYETDGRTITPQRYVTYFGPGIVLKSFPVSLAISAGFWLAAGFLAAVLYRRRAAKRLAT